MESIALRVLFWTAVGMERFFELLAGSD